MQLDLDTKEGMEGAVAFTRSLLGFIKDGGTWVVPRSGTLIRIDHTNKIATRLCGSEAFPRVFKAMGWTWKDGADV